MHNCERTIVDGGIFSSAFAKFIIVFAELREFIFIIVMGDALSAIYGYDGIGTVSEKLWNKIVILFHYAPGQWKVNKTRPLLLTIEGNFFL